MIASIFAKGSQACWIGAAASLALVALAGAARASDGNVVALKQLGTGAQGASIYINQVGLRNVLSGPGSLAEADWQVLNDHPGISSSPLFVRSGAQAIVGSDVLLNLTQEGDDNSLALLGQGVPAVERLALRATRRRQGAQRRMRASPLLARPSEPNAPRIPRAVELTAEQRASRPQLPPVANHGEREGAEDRDALPPAPASQCPCDPPPLRNHL